MRETKPEVLIVTTDDDTHDYFIEKEWKWSRYYLRETNGHR